MVLEIGWEGFWFCAECTQRCFHRFVKQENIKLFVDWCMFAFSQFGSKARFWATLNEPNVQVVSPVGAEYARVAHV